MNKDNNQFKKRYKCIGSSVNIFEVMFDVNSAETILNPDSPVQLISTLYVDRNGFAIEVFNQ